MLVSRAVNRAAPQRTSDEKRSTLPRLLGALVVFGMFVLNLGGAGNHLSRDLSTTDEAAYQSSAGGPYLAWASAAPGNDTPDPLPPEANAQHQTRLLAALHATPPATTQVPIVRRGPSARAPPLHG